MKRKIPLLIILVQILFTGLNAQSFVHPGIPFTQDDLDKLKSNITREPWKSGYKALSNDWRSAAGYGMQGPREVVGRAPDINRPQWQNDMVAIHNQAFMWIFTGNPLHAEKGISIINEWAKTHRVFSGDENFLDLGDYAHYFVTGVDILKHTTPPGFWTNETDANVKKYFETVLWPVVDVPYPVRGQNQGAIQLKPALAIAAFLDNREKWQQASDAFLNDAGGGLANSLPNGQIGDAGRDWGHWHGQADALAWCSEVVYKQGIDAFSYLNNRMLAISELYCKRKQGNTSDAYIPHGGTYGCYNDFGGGADGRTNAFLTNIIEGAYKVRRGIPTPQTTALSNISGNDALTFLYKKESDASAATIPAPPVFPEAIPAVNLTSADVGNIYLKGSAQYNNSIWSLKGAGQDIPVPPLQKPDAFHYAFQEITGNAVIISKITSLEEDARTGLMFRTGLDENSKYAGIFYSGSTDFSFRGPDGWSKTATSWNNAPGGYLSHWCPSLPYWFKLERRGDKISGYHSPDGINWTCLGIAAFDNLQNSIYVGLCVTSKNTSKTGEATFENVSISRLAPAGSPVITSTLNIEAAVNSAFSYTITASGNPTGFTATGLPPGLTLSANGEITGTPTTAGRYFITLSAGNGTGTGTATLLLDVISSTAPATPTDVTLADSLIYQVYLSWTPSAGASGYSIGRATTPGGPYTTIAGNITATSYLDINANSGYNYYIVTAYAGNLASSPSIEKSILLPPAIPSKPIIANTSNSVILNWEVADGAESYNVKRSETSGGPYTTIASGITHTTYTDLTVIPGNYYYYVVTSTASGAESEASAEEFGASGANAFVWSAAPVSNVWSEPQNWVGGIAPVSPAIIVFGNTTDSVLTNDISGLEVISITFAPDASHYLITGNEIEIRDAVTNQSGSWQDLNLPVKLAAMVKVNVITEGLAMNEKISGSGGIIKRGFNFLNMHYGGNTYSGGTIIYDSYGGWGPNGAINIKGSGTESGTETIISDDEIQLKTIESGPLGTGKITMSGGALRNDAYTRVYNEIHFTEGTKSFIYNNFENFDIDGKFTGKGTVETDGNHAQGGIGLWGDNREFEGTYINVKRSSWTRTRFEKPRSIGKKARYELKANFTDSHRFINTEDIYRFGELSGEGLLRTWTDPVIEVGHLNTDSEFSGSTNGGIKLIKTGTGKFAVTGQTYFADVKVNNGKLYVTGAGILDAGAFTVESGATLGGNGSSSGSITVNSGGKLAPGNDNTGTYHSKSGVVLNNGAVLNIELNAANSDKLIANGITINNALLNVSITGTPTATQYVIVENTSSAPVNGTFNGLNEFDIVAAGGVDFRITYKGGNGNDIVLIDKSSISNSVPAAIQNLSGTALSSKQIKLTWDASPASEYVTGYTIERAPTSGGPYTQIATGITDTGYVDSDNSFIAQTAYYYRVYATNFFGDGAASAELQTATAALVTPDIPENIKAIPGFNQVTISWQDAFEAYSYEIKRSETPGGPYTTIATNIINTVYTDLTTVNGTTYYYVVVAVNPSFSSAESPEIPATPTADAWSYYPLNEGAGIVVSDVWNSRDGQIMGSGNWTQGVDLDGFQFDGNSNSYIKLPDGGINTLTDFTVSIWAKLDAQAGWARIWDFGRGQNNYMFLSSNDGNSSGPVRFAIKNGSNEQQINSFYVMRTNKWTHLTVAKSGTTAILYVNGTEAGRNDNVTISPSDLGHLNQNYIGNSQWPDPMLKGTVDDIRIYSKALTAAEIADIVSLVAPDAPKNLTATAGAIGVDLSWDVIPGATYNIMRAPVSGGSYTTIKENVTLNSHTDYSANHGAYYYVITASVNGFESPSSDEASITLAPASPNEGIALGWNGKIDLSWEASAGADSYKVKRSLTPGGPYTETGNTTGYSFCDSTGLANGIQYYYVLSAINAGGESENGDEFSCTPTEATNYTEWEHADIGATGLTGNAGFTSDSIFTVYGAGDDIWGNSDSYHFVYKKINGDVAIVAKLLSLEHTHNSAKGGVMLRETLDANSPNVLCGITPEGLLEFGVRSTFGGSTNTPNDAGYRTPQWVKLTRSGNEFRAYGSPDGINWAEHTSSPQTVNLPNDLYIGVVALSHNTSVLIKTEYDRITVSTAYPVIGGSLSEQTAYGADFEYFVTATNEPYHYAATNLPGGLSIDSVTGRISGKPTILGVHNVNLSVRNAMGETNETLVIHVDKADQTITFNALPPATIFDTDFSPGATASSGLPVTYSTSDASVATIVSGNIHITGIGTCMVYADQSGDTNYNVAPQVSQQLTVTKADQTILFSPISEKTILDPDFSPGAAASSGLPVIYSTSDASVATIVNGNVHIAGIGSCMVYADQNGNSDYNPAPRVGQKLTVNGSEVSNELINNAPWYIYPTIVTDNFVNIVFNKDIDTEKTIRIFDMYGKIEIIERVKGDNTYKINMSNLSSGIYIVSIDINGKLETEKIVKQ